MTAWRVEGTMADGTVVWAEWLDPRDYLDGSPELMAEVDMNEGTRHAVTATGPSLVCSTRLPGQALLMVVSLLRYARLTAGIAPPLEDLAPEDTELAPGEVA